MSMLLVKLWPEDQEPYMATLLVLDNDYRLIHRMGYIFN